MSDVTTLVFDLGNVLVRWDPRTYYRQVFDDEQRMEWFLTHVCNHAWNQTLDSGVTYREVSAQRKQAFPEFSDYIDQFEAGWEHMFWGVIQENVTLLERAKALGVPIYAITNWSHEKFPRALELFPFLKLFDGMVVSGYEKLIKPDPAIFQLFLNRYGKQASECFFIDDLKANVEAAKSLGFKGHVFHDVPSLHEALRPHLAPHLSQLLSF